MIQLPKYNLIKYEYSLIEEDPKSRRDLYTFFCGITNKYRQPFEARELCFLWFYDQTPRQLSGIGLFKSYDKRSDNSMIIMHVRNLCLIHRYPVTTRNDTMEYRYIYSTVSLDGGWAEEPEE